MKEKFAATRELYAATIGCFDGVHRGHQLLIGTMLRQAGERGLASMVITFDRQPRALFDPTFRPQLLSTPEEKEALVRGLGVGRVEVLPFTQTLAGMTARDFMRQVLRDELGVTCLVTGYDNRFGHNREEGFDDYVRYGRELGIEVVRGDVALFCGEQRAVSSSAIRQLLAEGDVERAAEALSRPYRLTGTVVSGEHIGHGLGFPTANLRPDHADKLVPGDGAYAVWATLGDGERLAAMMNIGTRPTFDGQRRTLEVHLLDFDGDVYGQRLTVEFVSRLRAEMRFDSPKALKEQLKRDREMTQECLDAKKIKE